MDGSTSIRTLVVRVRLCEQLRLAEQHRLARIARPGAGIRHAPGPTARDRFARRLRRAVAAT
jgi:hypothetical protein